MILNENNLVKALSNKRVFMLGNYLLGREYLRHLSYLASCVTKAKGFLDLVFEDGITPLGVGKYGEKSRAHKFNQGDLRVFEELEARNTIKIHVQKTVSDKSLLEYSFPGRKLDAEGATDLEAELNRSIRSALLSCNYVTLEKEINSNKAEWVRRESQISYNRTRALVKDYVDEHQYDLIIVTNGRFPEQVAVKHEAISAGLPFLHFERGVYGKNRLFIQPFQTQDIGKMSEYFRQLVIGLNDADKRLAVEFSTTWLAQNEQSTMTNPHVRSMRQHSSKTNLYFNERTVPIFTSSIDERVSNLPHDLNGWEGQYQAIESLSNRLRELRYDPLIRIHPNAIHKSWAELLELLKMIKRIGVKAIMPWSTVSTYEILESAPLVVTWASTVSLESTARGIPTANLGPTKFGDLIDIEKLSPNLIPKWEPNLSRKPSINKSLLAIYVTRNYGLKNESEFWIDTLSLSKIHTGKRKKVTVYWHQCLILFRSLIQPYSNTPSALYNPLRKFLGPSIASRIMNIYAHFLAK